MGTPLLLLIVGLGALAAGILVGRYYVPDDRLLKRRARRADGYMRAISALLSRDRDGAIDELRAVVQENLDDVEPYFALGALFRSRGEWERAIRVHQAIEMRESGDKKLRLRARYELGLDFRAAGMPRRATRAMEDCLDEDNKHVGALRALCGLYEEQGRYAEAATAWRRLDKLIGEGRSAREQHLLAAAAQRAIASGDTDSGKRLLRDAERGGEDSAHVEVAAADLAAARGKHRDAAARLIRALELSPGLAMFIVPQLPSIEREIVAGESGAAGEQAREEEALRRAASALVELIDRTGHDPHLMLALAELRSRFDVDAALEVYREVAVRFPDLLQARIAAGRLALASGREDEIARELRALVAADGVLAWASRGEWRCSRCGRVDAEYFWRCEGCRQWSTAALDVGRLSYEVPKPPRERRGRGRAHRQPRVSGETQRALPPALDQTSPAERAPQRSLLRRLNSALGRDDS